MELSKARSIGESLLKLIGPAVKRAEIAGSVRREKETVKDIELVIIIDDYEALFGALRSRGKFIKPGVPDIIEWPPKVGAKYLRLLLDEGIKLDVFVATPANWGALLCMRTGSATAPNGNVHGGFVPKMFSTWKKVSGGGRMLGCLPTRPDGTQVHVPEERDFFDLLNVQWVEPRDRTSSKVVKAK